MIIINNIDKVSPRVQNNDYYVLLVSDRKFPFWCAKLHNSKIIEVAIVTTVIIKLANREKHILISNISLATMIEVLYISIVSMLVSLNEFLKKV